MVMCLNKWKYEPTDKFWSIPEAHRNEEAVHINMHEKTGKKGESTVITADSPQHHFCQLSICL